jgi:hypothetical protein
MGHWTIEEGELGLEPPVAAVDVRLPAGAVTVAVSDGPPRVIVTDVQGGPVTVHQEGGTVTIRHPGPEGPDAVDDLIGSVMGALGIGRRARRQASVTVLLPDQATVTARTVGAPVMFSGLEEATVDTVTGDIVVSRLHGSLRIATVGGSVQAADIGGRLSITTVSGEVTVASARLSELRARTVSGDVTVDAELLGGGHAFQAVSGNLALRLRAPQGFDLDASSVSGTVVCQLGDPVDLGRPGRRRVRVAVGDGGARLRSHTVSGNLTVLSPAGAA